MTDNSASPLRTNSRNARDKIRPITELGKIAARAKAEGLKVVLCHGVFDLLHMGHVRHLEAARREGSLLIVTVTADKCVNKGPDRPVFTEQLRSEMLASLEYVDWVGINEEPSAVSVLKVVKPDIYVKGSDYKSSEVDITGKIISESKVVEDLGGKVIYTDEITFSSSTLINQHLGVYEPTLQQYLEVLRSENKIDELIGAVKKIQNYKILFIGDAIIDEYQYVKPMGKSAKENMISALFKDREIFAGGVFAAANNVADFCQEVEVITALGSHDTYEELARETLKSNVKLFSFNRNNAPTTRKCRLIDSGYSIRKMFEIYFMDDTPLWGQDESALLALIEDRIEDADVVIVTDFGHGLLGKNAIKLLTEKAKFLAVNTQSNSANHGFNLISKYKRADYICIDGPEAQLAVQDKFSEVEKIMVDLLPAVIECPKLIITQGKHGCCTYDRVSGITQVPALTKTIVDTVGAGDAFFVLTAPLVAAGIPMDIVGLIGNAAGAMKVGIVGHRNSVEKIPLIKFLTALLK